MTGCSQASVTDAALEAVGGVVAISIMDCPQLTEVGFFSLMGGGAKQVLAGGCAPAVAKLAGALAAVHRPAPPAAAAIRGLGVDLVRPVGGSDAAFAAALAAAAGKLALVLFTGAARDGELAMLGAFASASLARDEPVVFLKCVEDAGFFSSRGVKRYPCFHLFLRGEKLAELPFDDISDAALRALVDAHKGAAFGAFQGQGFALSAGAAGAAAAPPRSAAEERERRLAAVMARASPAPAPAAAAPPARAPAPAPAPAQADVVMGGSAPAAAAAARTDVVMGGSAPAAPRPDVAMGGAAAAAAAAAASPGAAASGAFSTPRAPGAPRPVDAGALDVLEGAGFSFARALRALLAGDGRGLGAAFEWLAEHADAPGMGADVPEGTYVVVGAGPRVGVDEASPGAGAGAGAPPPPPYEQLGQKVRALAVQKEVGLVAARRCVQILSAIAGAPGEEKVRRLLWVAGKPAFNDIAPAIGGKELLALAGFKFDPAAGFLALPPAADLAPLKAALALLKEAIEQDAFARAA